MAFVPASQHLAQHVRQPVEFGLGREERVADPQQQPVRLP
jgi:hypothetical protein